MDREKTLGVIQLRNVELETNAIFLPSEVELLHGSVGVFKMEIPWAHLLSEHCKIYIEDVTIGIANGEKTHFLPKDVSEKGEQQFTMTKSFYKEKEQGSFFPITTNDCNTQ